MEQESSETVQMLDLETTIVGPYFKIFVKPKPSSLSSPLSDESDHPPKVHINWPKAYIQRIFSLSSSDKEGERVALEFVQNLKCNYASSDIISEALQCISMCKCKYGKFKRPYSPTMWLVLPYHSLFLNSFKGAYP